jgi:hypothetical protein
MIANYTNHAARIRARPVRKHVVAGRQIDADGFQRQLALGPRAKAADAPLKSDPSELAAAVGNAEWTGVPLRATANAVPRCRVSVHPAGEVWRDRSNYECPARRLIGHLADVGVWASGRFAL